ncbi:hypothetical protein BV898_19839, partial [Hypsibius exemplaris]
MATRDQLVGEPSERENVMNARVMTSRKSNTSENHTSLEVREGFYLRVIHTIDFFGSSEDRGPEVERVVKELWLHYRKNKPWYYGAHGQPKAKQVILKVADKCLLFSPMRKVDQTAKLTHFFTGPYEVLEQTSPVNFRISYNRPGETKGTIINVARLKQWHDRQRLEQEVAESSDQESAEITQRTVTFNDPEVSEETVESDPQSLIRKELPASLKPKEVAKCTFCNKPVIGPCTKGTIIGGKPTMKHANEIDGRFCAARRRTEVAQNSESTEEEYFIPDGRKVTTINELQPPQEPATKRASVPVVGEQRERENSLEIPVQQPRRTTLQTTPITNNTRPARKQRRKVEVSESGEEQGEAEQAEEEYAVRKSGRQRNQTKRYGFTNLISKLPLWVVAVFMIIMIPEIHAIEAQGCQCQNKKLLGSLDLSKYTQCEKVADKPSPRKVTYEVFAMKKASVFFPATLCKATVQSITVTKFFWGST